MTKNEIEKKKEMARLLYMQGEPQQTIAERVCVSANTISRWVEQGGWKTARAAQNISRPELVNKLLRAIDSLIESVTLSGDPEAIGSMADKLAKFSKVIQNLDKKANVVDAVEVFMAFNRWIQDQANYDPQITPELIKQINYYQNKFLMESMSKTSFSDNKF